MKSKNSVVTSPLWWIILIMLGLAGVTIWWFGREIRSIDQRIESIEKN